MNNRLAQITDIINEWDPVGLFPLAPDDEYQPEIRLICEYLRQNGTESLGDYIHRMFTQQFGSDVFHESREVCKAIAERIVYHAGTISP